MTLMEYGGESPAAQRRYAPRAARTVEVVGGGGDRVQNKRVFGVEHSYIGEHLSQDEISDEWASKVLEAYQTEASPYLQRALRDYRLALEHAEDTGFYCFRSVESLRQFYDSESDQNSWEMLRSETGVSQETIEQDIQKHSKDRRHGDLYSLTAEERKEILKATWKVLDLFINSIIE